MSTESSPNLHVAVIGCGIVGVLTAIGLVRRNVNVTVYEQASELREIGAGVGFMRPATECMTELDPRVTEILAKVGISDPDPLRWIDGMTQEDISKRSKDNLHDMEIKIPDLEIRLCHRAMLVAELVNLLPPGVLQLGKRLEGLHQDAGDGKVQITFSDGQEVLVDAVIGCDGLKSRVRRSVLDPDDPAATVGYAQESAYRTLVDMDKAAPVLGELSRTIRFWVGKGAHLVTYPIANYKYLNVAAFVRDVDWPDKTQQTTTGYRKDIVTSYASFGPNIRALIDILPEEQSRWGMFDTLDNPLSTYAYGSVVLAGDAAHASCPHHGYGASMGVEDAVVLVSLLAGVDLDCAEGGVDKKQRLTTAFKIYDSARRERSQWQVASARRQQQLAKGEIPGIGSDRVKFVEDTRKRVERIVGYDWEGMVAEAMKMLEDSKAV